MKTTVNDLKIGDSFKLSKRHRKIETLKVKSKLGKDQPKQFQGMYLLVTETCKTIALPPERELVLIKQ